MRVVTLFGPLMVALIAAGLLPFYPGWGVTLLLGANAWYFGGILLEDYRDLGGIDIHTLRKSVRRFVRESTPNKE